MISEQKLDFWVKNNLNVLFTGKPGVGKTAIIKNTFDRNKISFQYFSAPTMDPWVDLIGVPKESIDENGNKFLDLVRPKMFAFDEVQALFFDELNRAPAKVRNAVMELIQFRSINGKVFKNLKFIWAAINPEDEERTYDVERLDPAQKDRFPVQISIDYKPDKKYFFGKFGSDKGGVAIEWWNKIPKEHKDSVTPRRLDYALDMYQMGGDLRDILPNNVNVTKLISMLEDGLATEKIISLYNAGYRDEIETMLNNDDIYTEVESWITSGTNNNDYIFPFLPSERIAKFLSNIHVNRSVVNRLMSHYHTSTKISGTVMSYTSTCSDSKIKISIIESIPALTSTKIGVNPVSFTPTCNDNTAFSQFFEMSVKTKDWARGNALRDRIILESQSIPYNASSKDCKSVIEALIGCIRHSRAEELKKSYVQIFGPLNYALQKSGIDITCKNSLGLESKIVINKLITSGMEEFVWTKPF